ncbi:MAG TPA: trehalose-phosphatase [Actinomycetota bacterium]|nr:trehalose-phosphatase [Actinomycetota bacterium]
MTAPDPWDLVATIAREAERAALCLDYDGTLAPIVPDPEAAVPLPGVPALLARLARRFAAVALISGRPAAYLVERVGAPGARYLGLYGAEEVVDGRVNVDPEVEAVRPEVRAALAELRAHPAVVESGAWVEDKGLAVAVHLRRVADPGRRAPVVEEAAREVAGRHGLEVLPGRLVWELRPPTGRDKGSAVRQVVAESGAGFLVVAGDDVGDLAAFRAAVALAADGVRALRVAVRSPESPPELLEEADLVVDGPEGVRDLLESLAGAAGP